LAEAWQAQLWLAEGHIARAAVWARDAAADLPGQTTAETIERVLAVARVWLAQNKPAQAVDLLSDQSVLAEQAAQRSAWLRLDALRAVALDTLGQRGEALAVLNRALVQVEEEGYTRTILDEGQPMARLLSAALEKGENRQAVVRLLSAFSRPSGPDEIIPPGLEEMLSPRELEILGLLATDASNADIAGQCYITVNTLKKHTSSIYGKLGVSTRLQAVQRARQLNLI
jgi:LuxR family maltose regulon positive regulatory protein